MVPNVCSWTEQQHKRRLRISTALREAKLSRRCQKQQPANDTGSSVHD